MRTLAPALDAFHEPVRRWFDAQFDAPTEAQVKSWPAIAAGRSTLLLAPTGSGKTLAAFLAAIDRLLFEPETERVEGVRVLYVSPLKALSVDVERNLRAPLAGIAAAAAATGEATQAVRVGIRTGDTPQREREAMRRTPPEILVTTPESLYLLLTSRARETLRTVETVIVDEIHAMVGTKRGAHLLLSLERLEALRAEDARPLQRIGLSATLRPLDVVARALGGMTESDDGATTVPRPVDIVDAGAKKRFDLRIEVPVEDMADLGREVLPDGAAAGVARTSIWPAIHPMLVDHIRAHRSTILFVNSRRLAERLAGALNETAEEELALAHHGSIARKKRQEIEDRLKQGRVPAIVATSTLELGIDMGAVDQVIQIEAPPTVASGMQRIGRAGHHVGAVSRGVIVPKFRSDLLACAAASRRMRTGDVEALAVPANPLDVLAQHIVAIVAIDDVEVDTLYALARRAAPFAELPRSAFEGLLDMLSGRYPSDEFSDLRPRLTWDRTEGTLTARRGAHRLAVLNGGTIPDRGLYGVFLAGDQEGRAKRVGELDEEMVFESRVGDVFVLGASSWRVEEITPDRVLVSPAPGEPAKMPFWHGDRPGRPFAFGEAIGGLARDLLAQDPETANRQLTEEDGLDAQAAENLVRFLADQAEATGDVPSDTTLILERQVDELGDWRVCLLSPFGMRVHAAWAIAVATRLRASETQVETLYTDDGIVFRLPESPDAPALDTFMLAPGEVEELVVKGLLDTPLFASRFRENAARALLLPRRNPARRTPLWAQRKRAATLLSVAVKHPQFPILLETYRECLKDVLDVAGLVELLRRIEQRRLRVRVVDVNAPSPFAASILFSYVATTIYEGDQPLAERRARVLTLDMGQLRELLGEAEMRSLLDAQDIEALELVLQRLDPERPLRDADDVHDLLLALGDLGQDEFRARTQDASPLAAWIEELERSRRIVRIPVAGTPRYVAVEDAARYRDALGAALPPGLPQALLEPVDRPLDTLVGRYARTHGPFGLARLAHRFGLAENVLTPVLARLVADGRLVEGEFLPSGRGREWCEVSVLRRLKRKALARLRRQIEPVEQAALARFLVGWHGLDEPTRGPETLRAAIEQLEGAPLIASTLERHILPARVAGYRPGDLDLLCAQGEVTWVGLEPVGTRDGRIAIYRADRVSRLVPPAKPVEGELAEQILALLEQRGALFFRQIADVVKGFRRDLLDALWELVWAGWVTNDTLGALRSQLRPPSASRGRRRDRRPARQAGGPPGSEGRWSLVERSNAHSETERRTALTESLLARHGVVTREALKVESVRGGFASVYPVLREMEAAGRVRRGYFVDGLGAAQFAAPGADEVLRTHREQPEDGDPRAVVLAASDPANPYGAALPWPADEVRRASRSAGARVLLVDGALSGWLSPSGRDLVTWLPEDEPRRGRVLHALAAGLVRAAAGESGLFLEQIDAAPPGEHPLASRLTEAGFASGPAGWRMG